MEILCGLTVNEIFELINQYGFEYSHALSVSHNLYKKKLSEIDMFKDISNKLKDSLACHAQTGLFSFEGSEVSDDNTVKYLFCTSDGRRFETVYIPDGKRRTVCVSTQSGCRMGCPFCVTGSYGFHGNLTAGEILNQIISIPNASDITHVVFMGMGEPMDNLENVLKACEIATAQWGLSLSPRNITVSTVGIMPALKIFLEQSNCNLSLSLHSPFPEERLNFVPAEKKYSAIDMIDLMKKSKIRKGRRLTVGYVMIEGMNDSDEHLTELITLIKGSAIRVNLLPYHVTGNKRLKPSSPHRILHFKHNLVMSGISASVRRSRGEDISAACGLLASGMRRSY